MHRILIIEDEPDTRRNLALMLEMEGYAVEQAADGQAGLALARTRAPDLILCDVTMPGLDGHAVLAALRAGPDTEAVPFVFLTARGERQDLRAGMNLGADDYLTKPACGDEVLAAIRARLERRQRQAQALAAQATRGRPDFRPDFTSPAPLAERFGLTPREAEVLLWLAQGKTNAEIGAILGNAERTVKIHVAHIFEKLGVENRHAAIVSALNVLGVP